MVETLELPTGVTREPADHTPPRGVLGYARDKALDVAQGVIDVANAPPTIMRDLAVEPETKRRYRGQMEEAADSKRLLESGKTEYGQRQTETGNANRGFAQEVAEGVIDVAPQLAIAATLGGPAGAMVFGATGYSGNRAALDDRLRRMSPKDYDKYRQAGESDDQVRERLYSTGIPGALVEGAGGAAGGGALQGATRMALRRSATTVTDRILKRVGVGAAEGGVAGAGMGAASETGRQMTDVAAGFEPGYDPSKILDAAGHGALTLGTIGAIGGALHRGPPPIGVDVETTLKGQMDDTTKPPPGGSEPAPPEPHPINLPPGLPPVVPMELPPTPAAKARQQAKKRAPKAPIVEPVVGVEPVAGAEIPPPGVAPPEVKPVAPGEVSPGVKTLEIATPAVEAPAAISEVAPKEPPAKVTPKSKVEAPTLLAKGEEDLNVALRKKLGIPEKATDVTHGPPAQPIIDEAARERQARYTDAAHLQNEGAEEEARRREASAAREGAREEQATEREKVAKTTYEEHAPGGNRTADLAGLREQIEKSNGTGLIPHVQALVNHVKAVLADYREKITKLAAGNEKHEVFRPFREWWPTRAGVKAGPYHSHLATLHNFVVHAQKALDQKMFARMKDESLKILKADEAVRGGGAGQVKVERVSANESRTVEHKTAPILDDLPPMEATTVRSVEEAERNLERKPPRPLTAEEMKRKGIARVVGRDAQGRLKFEQSAASEEQTTRETQTHSRALEDESAKLGRPLTAAEATEVLSKHPGAVMKSTVGEVLGPKRPEHPVMRAVFDRVRDLVKDIPVTIMSPAAMDAFTAHVGVGRSYGLYHAGEAHGVIRSDRVLADTTPFHEALHAATSRVLYTSPRLEFLVKRLISAAAEHYRDRPEIFNDPLFRRALFNNTHEFVAELFTQPRVVQWMSGVELKGKDLLELRAKGYQIDKGANLLKSLWHGFLEALGFKPTRPNGLKIAVDLVEDMFQRETELQARDRALGNPVGMLRDEDIDNLRRMDPIRGSAAVTHMRAGRHSEAVEKLIDMAGKIAESGDERTAQRVVDYLKAVNSEIYERPEFLQSAVTPVSNSPAGVTGAALNFLRNRMGETGKDLAFKLGQTKFGTEKNRFSLGLHSTFDLAKRGSQQFQAVTRPLMDALAKRETFVRRFMDDSGANELLNRMAQVKTSIGDRKLWARFEQLLIKEGYHGAFVDEPLHDGRNKHVSATDMADEQTRQNHAQLQAEWSDLSKNERLRKLRDDLHSFGATAIDARTRAHVGDMVTRLGMVDPDNALGRSALVKSILHKAKEMTPNETAEYTRLENAGGAAFTENVSDIRKTPEFRKIDGPYVPFLRHGKHAVYAEYHVKPADGVDVKASDPNAALKTSYDFLNEADAQGFIKKQLGEQGITQTGGHEVVYDKRTGERAKTYTAEEWKKVQEEDKDKPPAERRKLRDIPASEVKEHEGDAAYANYEVRHRVTFNPRELSFFENERLAHEHSERLRSDPTVHSTGAETPHEQIGRANVAYTSAEMQKLVNRVEASTAYQHLTESQQTEWKRELKAESARVTMTAGRRSMFLPREYAKGASTDILRNYLDMTGSHARAMADLSHRGEIDRAFEGINAHNNAYRYQAGDGAARVHQDIADELRRRVYAPPTVDSPWAHGVRRALQVSMISHLADTGFLAMNATEPWVIHLPIISGRHGLISAATELARAYGVLSPAKMAKAAMADISSAAKNKREATNYEKLLLDGVTGQKDAAGLAQMFKTVFEKGLLSRDVGMEVERLHDLTSGKLGKAADYLDNLFRGANTGVETMNRAAIAISSYRLEMRRAMRDGVDAAKAHDQAVRYAEDSIFRGAGDYATWNSPRYFNAPWAKLGLQFKKYPQRMIANYADAIMGAVRGDTEKMKQVAWMLGIQSLAAGALGLPLGPMSGAVNTAYILGLTDNNWNDVELGFRKAVAKNFGPEVGEVLSHGVLRLTGADIGSRLSQNSLIFFGSPDSRKGQDLLGTAGRMVLGAPGDMAAKFHDGIVKMAEAHTAWSAGADSEGWAKMIEGTQGVVPVKVLTDITQAYLKAAGGPATHTRSGVPLGNEYTTAQAITRALGFTPSVEAEKSEARRGIKREQTQYQQGRTQAIQMYINAANPAEKQAVWRDIQRNYNPRQDDPGLKITYSQLLQSANRTARATATDNTKLGIPMTGRRKPFADVGGYFNTGI